MSNEERSKYQIECDIRYSVRLWELQARFWSRFGILLTLISLIGGAAAVASVVAKSPMIATISGVILAVSAALGHALAPATRLAEGKERLRAYSDLRARALGMDASALDEELRRLEVSDYLTLESLRHLAYDDNVKAHGHDSEASNKHYLARVLRLA